MAADVPPLADPERALALAYVPRANRAALHALWALDEALGGLVAQARDPMLAQIRLAWWRDALLALGGRGAPPVDPLLRALDDLVATRLDVAALGEIAEGWAALLGEPDNEALATHARERGASLFAASAALLGGNVDEVGRAGRLWALVDVAARLDPAAARRAMALARQELGSGSGIRWPKPLRPLGMLAALAVQEARRDEIKSVRGGPARVARMIAHRLTGRTGLGGAPPPR